MGHPEISSQIILADNWRCAIRRNFTKHQSRINVAQLKQRLYLELQIVRVEIVQEIDVSASEHVDGLCVSILIARCNWIQY